MPSTSMQANLWQSHQNVSDLYLAHLDEAAPD